MNNDRKQIPNISSLHSTKNIRELEKQKIFTIVLNKCIEKIIETNHFTDQTFVYFEVPKFMIGFPGFNRIACIHYLMHELRQKNYKVEFMAPTYVYIDWSKNTNESKNLDNVFLQHIIPTSNPSKLKEETKELLKKYPNTSKIVFQYEDLSSKNNKNK